jgi:hypothetical protein
MKRGQPKNQVVKIAFRIDVNVSYNIAPCDLAGMFNRDCSQVVIITKGVSGFKATAICHLYHSVFSGENFVAVNTFPSYCGGNLCSAHRSDIMEVNFHLN